MKNDNTIPSIRLLPSPLRRQLLKAGLGFGALPLLNACGDSSSMLPVRAPSPSPVPIPVPAPVPVPLPAPKTSVRGIHASFTGDVANTRALTWFTDGSTDLGSIVEWGPVTVGMTADQVASLPLPMRVEGSAAATFGIDVLTHRVSLTDVPGDMPIRYRVGADGDFSEVQLLQATPAGDFRFVHFGDSSTSAASKAVMAGTLAVAPDMVVIAGDLSYANGEQAVWDTWFDQLQPLASRIPVMTCPGNHEAKDGGGQGYSSRVSQPGEGTYYSFDYNRVHFCVSTAGCLLTEDDPASATRLAEELVWIDADLAQAALARATGEIDFIVFMQHYTIWTNEDGRSPGNASLIAVEEEILVRYGVDLLLVGHDHIYERSKPMAFGQPNPLGYVQITQGGGGQSLYDVLASPASWSQVLTARHGFTEFSVSGGSISANSWAVGDTEGNLLPEKELIDSFTLQRRLPAASLGFALPPLGAGRLLTNFDAIVSHTLLRNRLHDLHEPPTP